MSQVTNNKPGAPTKGPTPVHSRSKEEKQQRHLEKKARRAANVEAKRLADLQAKTDLFWLDMIAAFTQTPIEGTDDGTADTDAVAADVVSAGDRQPAEAVDDAGETSAVADPDAGGLPAVVDEPSVPDSNVEDPTTPDSVTEEPAPLSEATATMTEVATGIFEDATGKLFTATGVAFSGKDLKNAKWKVKTAKAAANAAANKERVAEAEAAQALVDKLQAEQAANAPTAEVSPDLLDEPPKVVPEGADFVSSVGANYDSTTVETKADGGLTDNSDPPFEAPIVEEPVKEPATEETPAAEEIVETPAEAPVDPVEEPKPAEEAPAEEVKPEAAAPTLVVDNTPTETEEQKKVSDKKAAAAKFYGAAFTPERWSLLTEAHSFLMQAVKAEAAGRTSMVEVALKRALALENSAFTAPMAKAA